MLIGLVVGQGLGWLVGVDANIGGVGMAMMALISISEILKRRGLFNTVSQQGILFWSSIYIPIIVAMAASQDVISAIRGGPVALLAGSLVTVACFAMVPILDRLIQPGNDPPRTDTDIEDRNE